MWKWWRIAIESKGEEEKSNKVNKARKGCWCEVDIFDCAQVENVGGVRIHAACLRCCCEENTKTEKG